MADDALLNLAQDLGEALSERGWSLVLAESCTGGWAGQVVTAVAGSSAWFDRGFVTYSNAAKTEMLGVSAALLHKYGAVSIQAAEAMALGALLKSHAHVAAAITGIAGPDGSSADKPVGTVCFAWATENIPVQTRLERLSGDREQIRAQAVIIALQGVLAMSAQAA